MMEEYWNDNNDYYGNHHSKNKYVDPSIHIMNKKEKRALRQLSAKTGLKESELREIKAYRKTLSEAQKHVGNKKPHERLLLSIQKGVTKKLKLPKEHPLVIEELNNVFNEKRKYGWWSYIRVNSNEVLFKQLSILNKK